jgi:hypothetical protein
MVSEATCEDIETVHEPKLKAIFETAAGVAKKPSAATNRRTSLPGGELRNVAYSAFNIISGHDRRSSQLSCRLFSPPDPWSAALRLFKKMKCRAGVQENGCPRMT